MTSSSESSEKSKKSYSPPTEEVEVATEMTKEKNTENERCAEEKGNERSKETTPVESEKTKAVENDCVEEKEKEKEESAANVQTMSPDFDALFGEEAVVVNSTDVELLEDQRKNTRTDESLTASDYEMMEAFDSIPKNTVASSPDRSTYSSMEREWERYPRNSWSADPAWRPAETDEEEDGVAGGPDISVESLDEKTRQKSKRKIRGSNQRSLDNKKYKARRNLLPQFEKEAIIEEWRQKFADFVKIKEEEEAEEARKKSRLSGKVPYGGVFINCSFVFYGDLKVGISPKDFFEEYEAPEETNVENN